MFRLPLVLTALLIGSQAHDAVTKPKNGEELIAQMRERYAGKWYRTLTFTQKTTLPDGKVETWYEALELPGKLRIDIAPLDSMKTILFRNDSALCLRARQAQGRQAAGASTDGPRVRHL